MGKSILITLVAAVGLQIVWIAYEKFSYKEGKPDSLDRITIKPGLMSWFLSLLCTAFCIAFGGMTISSVITNDDIVFWLLLGPPLTALMGFGAYVTAWTRLRATGAYVEHRNLSGWQQIDWDDILGLCNHSILGSRLHIKGRNPSPVWVHGQGSREVRELFAMYEKPFEP